jgi:hypothetical protein
MRRVLGGCIVALGVVAVAAGVFGYVSTRRFIDRAARAAGTVVRLDVEEDSESGKSFRPVVQFRTPAGARVEFKSRVATKPPAYSAGDAVTVLYEANAPNRAEIDAFWPLWFRAIFGGVMGAGFLTFGGVMLLVPRRCWRAGH